MIKTLRFLSYRAKYIYAAQLNHKNPIDVSLELSSLCNQSCSYCYHAQKDKLPFKTGHMDLKTAKLIIAEAAILEVPSIKFNYRGESTLNPYFREITSFAKEHANQNTFIERLTNSNFKFRNDNLDIYEGLCNQTKVKISFDSFIPEVLESQRYGSVYSLALKNIDTFYNYKNRKNTEIVIQAVRTLKNKDEDLYGEIKKRWPSVQVSIRDMVSGRVEKDLSDLENKKRDFKNRISCVQAHARVIFDIYGNAQMCCPDIKSELNIGNIHDNGLFFIYNSMKALKIRDMLKNKSAFEKLDACKNCSSHESYKGYRPSWKS
jgi:sulfatase maturation enzyme AslB (radical SAM superfamily)